MKIPGRHPDQDGLDEWGLSIFDVNGDHSETVFDYEMGTLAECMYHASLWVTRNPAIQVRIVLEQVR